MRRMTHTLRQAALALSRRHVLIVEEDERQRAFMASLLREDGYEVSAVGSGEQAVARLARPRPAGGGVRPHVIVAGLALAGAGGLAALARLRAAGVSVPVILVGDVDDEEAVGAAVSLGAAAVVPRPLDLDDFRAAVLVHAIH